MVYWRNSYTVDSQNSDTQNSDTYPNSHILFELTKVSLFWKFTVVSKFLFFHSYKCFSADVIYYFNKLFNINIFEDIYDTVFRCFVCRLHNGCDDIEPMALGSSFPSSFPWLTIVFLSYGLKLLDCVIIGGTTLTFGELTKIKPFLDSRNDIFLQKIIIFS